MRGGPVQCAPGGGSGISIFQTAGLSVNIVKPSHFPSLDQWTSAGDSSVRVICDEFVRQDVRRYNAGNSIIAGPTNPVVVRYQALGITMAQTIKLSDPVLLVMKYAACG